MQVWCDSAWASVRGILPGIRHKPHGTFLDLGWCTYTNPSLLVYSRCFSDGWTSCLGLSVSFTLILSLSFDVADHEAGNWGDIGAAFLCFSLVWLGWRTGFGQNGKMMRQNLIKWIKMIHLFSWVLHDEQLQATANFNNHFPAVIVLRYPHLFSS